MKLATVDFALDCVEFPDRLGIFRTSHGCSLLGLEEFKARMELLAKKIEAAPQTATIASLYRKDKEFRRHCDRCLELNGVEPDWLDAQCVGLEGLLFAYDDGLGLLVRLNSLDVPAIVPKQAEGQESATVYDIGATLLSLSNDLTQVIELLQTVPAKQASKILEARAKQVAAANPEEKRQEEKRGWAERMRSNPGGKVVDLAELRGRSGG